MTIKPSFYDLGRRLMMQQFVLDESLSLPVSMWLRLVFPIERRRLSVPEPS